MLIIFSSLISFFLLKGLRAGVWGTRDLNIGGKNPTDTIKYFQQTLGTLANSLTDQKKSAISGECKKFIKNNSELAKKYLSCTEENQKWILIYLSMGKGTISYEMSTRYDF